MRSFDAAARRVARGPFPVWGHAARNRNLNVLARLAAGLAQEIVRRHDHEGQDNLGDDVEEGIGADLRDKGGNQENTSRRCIHQVIGS